MEWIPYKSHDWEFEEKQFSQRKLELLLSGKDADQQTMDIHYFLH